ncbi:esterase/lipase family protein [Actinocrispum wychmicini]|uniref:Lipase (Class 2) n=1 Tax=Actinocrispum wychmicini TaxID=1213861 RepID=A0A4R2JSR0_9PSEU|nr:alpha/beta fold hydrolase [Actinocrispum wychmicini]TCO62147.1 lipase (class 2) [Actinocrispum wychmicini]
MSTRPSAGYNDLTCKPSSRHPYPVIFLHGMGSNKNAYTKKGARLAAAGYCAYSLTYGAHSWLPKLGGVTDMVASAKTVGSFVAKVLEHTGAAKVDLVGASEGSTVAAYYIKVLGGAAVVNHLVGVSPNYAGTTKAIRARALPSPLRKLAWRAGAAFLQFSPDSDFMRELNSGGTAAVDGVRYTNIQSTYDDVVVPLRSGQLDVPNATNIILQDGCEENHDGHIAAILSERAFEFTLKALDAES